MKTICGSSCSIIDIAEDFYNTYYRCIENKNPIQSEYGAIKTDVLMDPAIVNGAFAIELYLKSMIKNKTINKRKGHNIYYLYSLLDEQVKNIIKKYVIDHIKETIAIKNIKAQNDNHLFNGCLGIISDAFMYWRYIFEKDSLDYNFIDTKEILPIFLTIIRNVTMERNADN